MPKTYQHPTFAYAPPKTPGGMERTAVAVVGGGPVGLTVAIDLARRGIATTLLDDDDTTSHGSRLICMSKRTLEVFDRIGVGAPFREKGVVWNTGRLFFGEDEVYAFDLLPDADQAWPAFINIQQYYVEDFLARAAEAEPNLDLRWKHAVVDFAETDAAASLTVDTPDGRYEMAADYVIACDGAASTVRRALDLPFVGRAFRDRFLITDVIMQADFPSERWFWFEPPFHGGQSALLHKQPDNVWRIDLQLDADADPEAEVLEENVRPRIERMLGPDKPFEIEWISLYTFRCRRLERFRHGRLFFAGDSAHQVSPFGARGGNGGVQDADNLAWKLAAVLHGDAPDALLDSYEAERIPAADENILNSTRSTDFMTPKSPAVRDLRDAVLGLAKRYDFARRMVNSGRLSVPAVLDASPLNTPDVGAFAGAMRPGAAAADAPIRTAAGADGWFLELLGPGFSVLVADGGPALDSLGAEAAVLRLGVDFSDPAGALARRYDLAPGTVYVFRPDRHVAARARTADASWVRAAIDRALAKAGAAA